MPTMPLGSQTITVDDTAALRSILADNINALWLAIFDYVNMSRDYIQQFKEDIFTGRIDANDWNVAAMGEDSGKTPFFLLIELAVKGQDLAWELLQELLTRDLLPPGCWDAHAQGMSPLLMIMLNAYSGNKKAWRILEDLTNMGKLTVAHWNASGCTRDFKQVTPFCILIIALGAGVENSEEFFKFLLTHLNFEAECLNTKIICNDDTYNTLFEYLMRHRRIAELLELFVDHNCWPNIDHWRFAINLSEGVKRSAIWLLISLAYQSNPGAHRLLEKIIPRIAWTPEIWNTVPVDCKDNPITALWSLVLSIHAGNTAGLIEFSQLIAQNCVTREGLQISQRTGVNAGQTIPWLLLNISHPAPELVWDVLKILVDKRLIDKSTWNMADERDGDTPISLLFLQAQHSQRAFEILIQLIEKNIIDKKTLNTKLRSINTTLLEEVVKLGNCGNQVAIAFFGHCAAAGLHGCFFQGNLEGFTVKRFSQEPACWQGIETTFDALTASNASAVVVAQKYIAKLHAFADAAPPDSKFTVEFKIKIHVMYAKYFVRCGLVLQAIEQVEAATAYSSRTIGVDVIFAGFCGIIEYYKTHPEGRWLQAYKLGQQCLAYLGNVKNNKSKVKKIEGEIKELKEIYLRNVSKDSRWQLTESHDFALALTESQMQAILGGDLELSPLFNNVDTSLEDARVLIIKNPMAVEQALLSVILSASDDRLLVTVVRKPSPEVTSEDEFAKNLEMQCSLNDDIYKRGVTCVGRVPDGPAPYFSQADIEKPYERILALPTPSLELPAEVYFWPPIAVTSPGLTQFVTVKRALLDEYEDLAKIFDPERKQIRFLCGGEVGAHGGAKRGEIDTPEGPWPMLLLKFCNNRGDEIRALATKIGDSDVYEVTEAPFDHKQEDRMLKGHRMRLI